ncbi:ATP-binding protein [Roseburia hominis]|uniref:ATP-binding protein n=1 Tax=Roseburia hominis TaxID=301301 RepID=UPI001F2238F0|nr:ATP-binding protein [Roseburia hominis]
MGRRLEYEVKTSVRLNMNNPQHVKINNVLQNLDPNIFKSKNQFIIDACQFYIDHYGEEQFMEKKERKRESFISVEDIDEIKAELIEVAMNEARKEVIKLLGGVISGMNVGQSVIRPSTYNKDEEPTEDVMDDADVAGLAMSWMSKGD